MLINKRSFLLGAGASLIAAPALVKAESLMILRGYNLDPKVIGFYENRNVPPVFSAYNDKILQREKSALEIIERLNNNYRSLEYQPRWALVRESELYQSCLFK